MLETRNSIYGNIAVTRTGKQVNFYQSGLFSGADNEGQASEMLVHLPLLAHRGPKKVLLVGTGFNGALAEILKHEPREVYYAELDPALGESAASYVSKDLLKALKDARVHLLAGDLRYYWAKLPRDLDAVIINLPNPSTALINRYFTEDFFKKAGECMKSDGIFSTHLSFSPDSVSVPLEELAASVYRSIKSEFPYIVTLPGDTLYFIASRRIFETDPELFIQRMEQRKITNRFATAPFIRDRYTTDRVRMVQEILKSNRSAKSNFDLYPSAYLYNTIYWLSLFHPGAEDWLGGIAKIPFWAWPLLGILALAMSFWRKRPLQEPDIRPGTLMFLGGFSLMSAEVLVIYGFQIFFGNLYYKIAWIMASIMIGMALGTLAGNKTGQVTLKNLANLHIFIAAFFALWLWLLYSDIQARWLSQEIVWFGLSLSIGILVGLEFPWASSLRGADAGKVYAADLFGSCLGALAVSVFLIPAYGFMQVLEILAAMNLLTAILTFYSQTPGTDSPSGQAPSFKPL